MDRLEIGSVHLVTQGMLGGWDAARPGLAALDWTGVGNSRLGALQCAPHYARFLLDRGEYRQAEEVLRPQWEFCSQWGVLTLELNLIPPLGESYLRLGKVRGWYAFVRGPWEQTLPGVSVGDRVPPPEITVGTPDGEIVPPVGPPG